MARFSRGPGVGGFDLFDIYCLIIHNINPRDVAIPNIVEHVFEMLVSALKDFAHCIEVLFNIVGQFLPNLSRAFEVNSKKPMMILINNSPAP